MIKVSGSRLNQGLWFPSLITELCRRAEVPIDANEEILSVPRAMEVISHPVQSELNNEDVDVDVPMEQSDPLPSVDVPPSVDSLSDQMSLLLTRQERFIRHQNMVNSAVEQNQRALFQFYDLQFTSFPSFPEDFFHGSSSSAVSFSGLHGDVDHDRDGAADGDEATWMDDIDD